MSLKECPCFKNKKDCIKRHKNCHDTCKEFKEWRAEKDADNEAKIDKGGKEYLAYIVPRIIGRKKRKNEKNSM